MRRVIGSAILVGSALLCSCAKQEAETPKTAAEAPAAAPAAQPGGPHATVNLTDGSKVPGTIVASNQTEMVVAGDDGIERKIPLEKVKSVDYGNRAAAPAPAPAVAKKELVPTQAPATAATPPPPPPPAAPTTRTNVLASGSDISVRTNDAIDSKTAQEGQVFDAQVTRDAKDADGDIVIPRGSRANLVIKSASAGGKFHGKSDLVLDLVSVVIGGKTYAVDADEIAKKGKDGVGVNKRTATYTGGGAALGAIIGAIAGGGKGAAIGAGAGAGAGAITQIATKGGSIKVPAESVLTFQLDKPLRVTVAQ
jgi:hypothetical protein